MEAWRGAWGSPPTALAGKCGTRAFPWRVVMMAGNLGELYANDLVLALSEPMQGDFSWVRPGQVAWDWWNHWGLEGTPFPAGVNTETYCAYIDFAADFGVEYVILDEGWAQNLDVTRSVPEIDLPAIARLVIGRKATDIIPLLKGIPCRNGTSCPDQLARALETTLAQ